MPLTAEQQEIRRTGFPSTEIGALIVPPEHRYEETRFDVIARKILPADFDPDKAETKQMERGNRMEGPLLDIYAEDHPAYVLDRKDVTYRHPTHERILGSPDALCWERSAGEFKIVGGVDAKTAGRYTDDAYGDDGTDSVPPRVIIQCCVYMSVFGVPWWDVQALAHDELRCYRLTRNDDIERRIIKAVDEAWAIVESGDMPSIDGSDGCKSYLEWKHPLGKMATIVETTDEATRLAKELHDFQMSVKDCEGWIKNRKNKLQKIIVGNKGLRGEWGSVQRISPQAKEPTVDWETVARNIYRMGTEFGGGAGQWQSFDTYVEPHSHFSKISPFIRLFWNKEKKA